MFSGKSYGITNKQNSDHTKQAQVKDTFMISVTSACEKKIMENISETTICVSNRHVLLYSIWHISKCSQIALVYC